MIFDGEKLARSIEAKLAGRVTAGLTLAILVLEADRAGLVYSALKAAVAGRLGIKVVQSHQPEVLADWAKDPAVNGILIQYPGWRGREFAQQWQTWVNRIPAKKDVDGLRPDSPFVPATVKAIEAILQSVGARGQTLVVGRGMVGRAAAKQLKAELISSGDPELIAKCQTADILVTACGKNKLISQVKNQAVVIDAGWPNGDVNFELVKNLARVITPVPGGVGPVTVVCLLENLLATV